ncbi:nuclear transport factor 2 family protein [Lysobacter sp. FW306-1B-D06B]|uniref:YybH family protein n=1 Tax=Lysobacter sp. FW306-1B-D06B TaxID=3140250 RepID=UPI00314050E2
MDPILATLHAYRDAVLAKDVEAFVRLYDDDLHVFDMWGDWSLRGLAAWRRMAQGWFGSLGDECVVVSFDDIQSSIAGAIAYGHATVTYTAQSKDGVAVRSLSNRMTLVLQRRGEDWKVVHEHTSAPIEHATLKAVLQRPRDA